MRRLEGKVALISGTGRGPGRAAALRFAAEGALVVGGDLLHDQALETQRLIAREGGTVLTPGPLDVTDEASVHSWIDEAVDAFGGIDIVYAQDSERLDSVRLTTRLAWPHLVRSRGCVVMAGPGTGPAGVLDALTRRLAAEGTPYGIRAHCVSPGSIDAAVLLASGTTH